MKFQEFGPLHRVRAAFLAISDGRSGESFFARAVPPLWPMYLALGGCSSVVPVAIRPTRTALPTTLVASSFLYVLMKRLMPVISF